MTDKQKLRLELAKHIYDHFRNCDAKHRGSKAFNWFESTGIGGDPTNNFNHKLAIWKLTPSVYQVDKGWENDHLDDEGKYQGPDIQKEIINRFDKD